ncbi:MAG: metallophosphoesterase family protein [Dehalococcoidales bacterium]|nr:metallophosphoesterase family protein [Dehalococcoidales bacterium]
MEQIAVISDVHGNMPALEAVLKDIKKRGIKRIFCLGDLVGKGPDSSKVTDICREKCEVVLLGNWDYFLADSKALPIFQWYRERLTQEQLDYLFNLPPVYNFAISGRKVRLYHASHIGVAHRVHMDDTEDRHIAMFENTDFTGDDFMPDTIGYGDIHKTFLKNIKGKVLFNAGSIGNPLDEPTAAYVIIEGNYGDAKPGYFAIQTIRLPYDIERAVKQARDADMPDIELELYEEELRTSRYRRDELMKEWLRKHKKKE